ncbi:hypothetical protein [Pontivivens insulae]|uniref:Acetoacetate decarboxylase n=1 Tax=Pontivivens insulae TaxID=1639689 RepID=A0A2R8AF90_9RHOB|nr:hypothetical protein [Pontivivens insulae]RED12145.1 hypothetical protein DFR53_2859 [Pontivivens insulae]SPF30901.1 hypothetical protein POI8812_03246 [Pontivivens insulae]
MSRDVSHLPRYVDRLGHGEICFPQPLQLKGTRSYAFNIAADRDKVQALLDSQLNSACAPDLRYTPVSDSVLLTYLEVETATSLSQTIGVQGDRECMFWIPMWEWKKGRLLPRLTFFVPYLFINVDTGLVVGREIWGYRKTLGVIDLPEPGESRFVCSTTIFPTFSDTTRAQHAEIVTVQGTKPLTDAQTEFDNAEGLLHAIKREMRHERGLLETVVEGATDFAFDIARLAFDFNVHVVNLKQFRAAEDWQRACYQAVCESPAHLDAVHRGGLLPGDWQASVRMCDSHQIVNDLGLHGSVDGDILTTDVRFAFWVEFDFTTLNGVTLWEAG